MHSLYILRVSSRRQKYVVKASVSNSMWYVLPCVGKSGMTSQGGNTEIQ